MPNTILSSAYNSACNLVSTIVTDPFHFLFKAASTNVTKKVIEPWLSEYPANQLYPLPAEEAEPVSTIKKLPLRVQVLNSAVGFVVGQATGVAVKEMLKLTVPASTEEELESIKEISQITSTFLLTPMISNLTTRALGTHKRQLNHDMHNTKKLPFLINILDKQLEYLDVEIKKLSHLKKNNRNPAAIEAKLEKLREERQKRLDTRKAKEAVLSKAKNKTRLLGFKR